MALVVTPDGMCLRVVTPGYVYHPPCPKTVKLAAVKHQIYHPSLPTFRAMERDDKMHKLADEHCRATTTCTRREFEEASMNPLKSAALKLHCIDITETGRGIRRMYQTMDDIRANTEVWSHYRDKLVSKVCQRRGHVDRGIPSQGNLIFDGVAVRYFKSGIRNTQIKLC